MMKGKITALSVSITCLFSLTSAFSFNPIYKANADFEMDANEIVEDIGFGWSLGNSLDSYSGTTIGSNIGSLSSETAWGNPKTTKEMIDMVKDSGVDTIRIPVTWYEHMDPETYEIDKLWMDRVEEVVNYVLEDGMYCIINVHHDTGEKGWLKANSTDLEKKKEMFTAIWEQVGESFAEYSDKLLFEGYNEILDDSPNQWYMPSSEAVPISNELNQIFVDTVRKTGGNNDKRNLICNTYCAGANKEITSGFVLPNDSADNRLIVETHIYQPFQFTSESYPDVTTWDSSALNMYVNNIYEQFVKNDIPVIIGEFGAASKNNNYDMMTWAKYYVTLCKGYGIPCIWWDNGSQYKIYNRRTLKVSNQELLNVMLAASKGEDYTINSGLAGDADNDGSVTLKDISLLESFILKSNDKLPSNCDLNKDNKINVIDLALLKNIYNENLSKEVNLCENEDNWSSWINTENGADGSMEYTENGIKLTVNSNGQYAWDEQVSYINLAIEKGAKYRIEFDYTSNQNVNNSFHIMQNYGSYTPYFSENLDYTPEVQHYKNIFTSSTDDNSVEIAFNCGNMTDDYPVTITIENLKLIKLS